MNWYIVIFTVFETHSYSYEETYIVNAYGEHHAIEIATQEYFDKNGYYLPYSHDYVIIETKDRPKIIKDTMNDKNL